MNKRFGGVMLFTFCFASKGKKPWEAKEQANQTGNFLLYLDGIFRYVCIPGCDKLFDYTTKEDVFVLQNALEKISRES